MRSKESDQDLYNRLKENSHLFDYSSLVYCAAYLVAVKHTKFFKMVREFKIKVNDLKRAVKSVKQSLQIA